MRNRDTASKAALSRRRGETPGELVCLALMLAMVALGWRILAVW
jgi:hypothetical protein